MYVFIDVKNFNKNNTLLYFILKCENYNQIC